MFQERRRIDLKDTSSGRSHLWMQPQEIRPAMSTLYNDLPSMLAQNQCLPSQHYVTTNQANHHYKGHPIQHNGYPLSKPLPLHKMQYNKDLHEKLMKEKPRRVLGMANQKTETTEEFCAKPSLPELETFGMDPCKKLTLKEHFKSLQGLDGRVLSSGPRGDEFNSRHRSAMLLNDPYFTNNMRNYRLFRPEELMVEGRNKGFDPPMVKREEAPMRDRLQFRSATTINRTPSSIVPVPNSGMGTVYRDDFKESSCLHRSVTSVCLPTYNIQQQQQQQQQQHNQQQQRQLSCDQRDWRQPIERRIEAHNSAPFHTSYLTEYQTTGSRRKVLV